MLEQRAQTSKASKVEVPGTGSLQKALAVLDLVASAGVPVRISDLLNRSGLPLGTLHRLLSALVAARMLRQDPRSKDYTLGSRIVDLAHSAGVNADLTRVVRPKIEFLSGLTRESTALALVEGDQVVYRAKQDGNGTLRISINVGERIPLHATSAGKVVLAYMDPDQGRHFMRDATLASFTRATVTDWERLNAELALVRSQGYATEYEEHLPGVHSIAAPLLDRRGYAIGALTVIGPAVGMTEDTVNAWVGHLLKAAAELAVHLGGDLPAAYLTPPAREAVPDELQLRLRAPSLLGSSPLWDSRVERLYWIDVLGPSLNVFDPRTNTNETFLMDDLICGIGLHADRGKLVLAMRSHICELDLSTHGQTVLAYAPADHGDHRFNKGGCDAAGRFWTSSAHMGGVPGAGCLFCLDPERGLHIMDTGLTLPNALAWSPDNRLLYLTESATRTIFAYDFDLASGEIGARRALVNIPPELGRPAGLTVDREGCLWSTQTDGWRLTRYSPQGEVLSVIALPVPSANGCGFGEPDGRTLFLATARDRLSPRRLASAPLAGSLFSHRMAVQGLQSGLFGKTK